MKSWRREMLAWLLSDQVMGVDGAVYSWHNPDDPGYAYPEIGGYLLSLLAQQGLVTEPPRNRIAAWLAASSDWQGGVGRDGLRYLFDTAILLGGLLAHREAGGDVDKRFLARIYSFVANLVAARGAACDGEGNVILRDYWSLSYGCHLLKLLCILWKHHQHTGQTECLRLIDQLLDDLCPLYQDGRFSAFASTTVSQLHAHCYAMEGLLAFVRQVPSKRLGLQKLLRGGADWLASVQHADGSLPEWHDGHRGWGKYRADVVAQAVRLWCAIDPVRFRPARERALVFLRRLHAPARGMRFEPASARVNTWATIFTVQALDWLEAPRPAEII